MSRMKTRTLSSQQKWVRKHRDRMRAACRRWRRRHPEKQREATYTWRARNRDLWNAYQHNWRKKNRLRTNAILRARRRENREAFNARRRAARQRSLEKYRLAERLARMRDPVSRRVSHRNAMAKRKRATGVFTRIEWLALLGRTGYKCHYCRKKLTQKNATPDHRIPLSRGGTNRITNIHPACLPCNQRKNALTEKEYLRRLARYEV
jgi:5-methylcytosine-specific restriction endonuclease McrA